MRLADLVDLEAQLLRDRDVDPAALARRDGPFRAGGGSRDPHAVLVAWLAGLRAAGPAGFPGEAVARALAAVRLGLVVAGLAAGWASASALLAFDGSLPVNVWDYLLAFVGVQLVLLVLLAVAFAAPGATAGIPLLGLSRELAGALVARLAARLLRGERGAAWRTLAHRLRSRRSLYRRLEPWLLLGLTQRFAVAFNVGVLAATLKTVVFTDVAFAWATTLVELSPARFHAIVDALSAPWAAVLPDAAPAPALVEATRYSRLERAYFDAGGGRAADPSLVGAWWPFLVAAVACYGLAPRLVALAAAALLARRILARLPFDDVEVRRALDRLAAPRVETRGTEAPGAGPPAPAAPAPARADAGEVPCALVLWRDVPLGAALREAVTRRAGGAPAAVHAAGGRDHEEGDGGLARLAARPGPVIVLAEAWEAPDKGALRLLRTLRAALGPRRLVLVLLADAAGEGFRAPSAEGLALWREGLARLEDPWLAVEGLAPAAAAAEGRA